MRRAAAFVAAVLVATAMDVAAAQTPAAVVAHNWSNAYVGVHAGYGRSRTTTDVGIVDPSGGTQLLAANGAFLLSYPVNRRGYVAGAQIGFGDLVGPWFWGIEADISAIRSREAQSNQLATCGICDGPYATSVSQEMHWLGTLRGRLGFTAYNWLFYGTGGLAFARVKYSYFLTDNPAGGGAVWFGAEDKIHLGWAAGGGVEYGFNGWSLRAEYLFYDLGDHTFVVYRTGAISPVQFLPHFENRGSILRLALNHAFVTWSEH